MCGQWLRYPHGVKEVMCTCGALLQLGGGASDGAKLEIDPVVLAKVVEMRQRVQDQRATIKSLRSSDEFVLFMSELCTIIDTNFYNYYFEKMLQLFVQ